MKCAAPLLFPPAATAARAVSFLCLLAFLSAPLAAEEWRLLPVPAPPPAALSSEALWYRAHLQVGAMLVDPDPEPKDLWRESMTLAFQDIPGPFKVYLNGREIIAALAADARAPQRFKVPKDILQKNVFNTLAIRLEGKAAVQGLTVPPVFGGYLDEVPLDREWLVFAGGQPPAEDLAPVAQPASAAYTPQDWRPARTVLQAPAEPVRGKQVSPEEALARLRPGAGLAVDSLLHEPEIAQPTHVSYDGRGRMWVAQYRQYPYPAGLTMISRDAYYRGKYDRVPPAPPRHTPGADIISVHEDTDGDGSYDRHRNVLTGLNMANAALHGYGGLWVMHTPYLLFYPDADGDDIPDREPEVRLAGFGLEDTHSVANGLAWGPEGWLYGAQGSTVSSHITRPGTEDAPLYLEGCAVWRYHPRTKAFEIFADGSGNTFGLHFDAEGRLFSGHNGGDTRGWHHIQDSLYLKQGVSPDKFGPPPNPFAFGELSFMPASHPIPRFTHNIVMMEGTALPARWRGLLLGADPLHQTLTASQRLVHGSSFSTTDGEPALTSDDMTFRPVYLTPAPDGSITVADFREEYIAHGQNYQGQIDPFTGRIYRLRGQDQPLEKDINLAAKTSEELLATLAHANIWHRQTAVRLLAERGAAIPDAEARLFALPENTAHPALELLWVLHQTQALDAALAVRLLGHPAPMVRAWIIRLLGDAKELPPAFFERLQSLAATEPDAEVRCQMLSTARRLPLAQALPIVAAILQRDIDEADPFIPLMAWFVLESHCGASAAEVVAWLESHPGLWSKKLVRAQITPRLMRRFAAADTREGLGHCARLLALAPAPEDRQALMQGFEQAFQGRALPALPEELAAALANLGQNSLVLRVRQHDPAALAEAVQALQNPATPPAERLALGRLFGEIVHPPVVPVLLALAETEPDDELAKATLASLTRYDDAEIGAHLAAAFPALSRSRHEAALALLAARPAWTLELLGKVETQAIPKAALSADLLGRLRRHQDTLVRKKLAALFSAPPPPAREAFRERIGQVKSILSQAPGDPYAGEAIYMERCAACHKLFFKGGAIGPNLTSYQREDLGTMLVSIIDPSAEIREGYSNHVITTKDGRVLGGFIADQDAHAVVLRGFDGNDITIPRADIAQSQGAGASLMPEGLLDGLTDTQLRDFFAYLRISQPISK